jgi:hypothetical protein
MNKWKKKRMDKPTVARDVKSRQFGKQGMVRIIRRGSCALKKKWKFDSSPVLIQTSLQLKRDPIYILRSNR